MPWGDWYANDPRVAGQYISRSSVAGYVGGSNAKEDKFYSIKSPLPCIARYGLQLHDTRIGPKHVRFAPLSELARASSFHQAQIDHLASLPQHAAMSRLANAVPAGMLFTVYACIIDQLLLRRGNLGANLFNISDDVHGEEFSVCRSLDDHVLDAEFLPDTVFRHAFEVLGMEDVQTGSIDPNAELTSEPVPLTVKATYSRKTVDLSSIPIHRPPSKEFYAAKKRMDAWHAVTHVKNPQTIEHLIQASRGHGLQPGDSRYLSDCELCDHNIDATPRKHVSSTDGLRSAPPDVKPGQKWMLDGGDATVRSKWGGHRYFLVFIDVASAYVVIYYMRDNSARSFVAALKYLDRLVRTMLHGAKIESLYGDFFSTHLDQHVLGALRADMGWSFEVTPPYCHWLNPYCENFIRVLKVQTRIRLHNLIGKTIDGQIIKDATGWWNFAMEHARQCKMAEPSSSAVKRLGIVATREQNFKQDHDTPTFVQLHPFGVTCFVVLQKSYRFSAVSDTAEKVLYMMNAQYNPFSHMYASAPQAHIVLRSNNRLQITGRAIFPYLRKRVGNELGADGTASGDATNMGESSHAQLADPFGLQRTASDASSGDDGDRHVRTAEKKSDDADLEVSSRGSPWVRQQAVVDDRMGVQTMIPSDSSSQVAPAAPPGSSVSPALPVTPFTSQPSPASESYPASIVQQFAVGRRGVTTSGTIADARSTSTPVPTVSTPTPSTAPAPVPTVPPSLPEPRRSARLSGLPTVDYARTCLLTSGGDVDAPAILYDVKTSASSNERFLVLRTEDHAIVKPLGKLADWMITAVTESMCTNLDQMTRDEIMYASDPCNFVMQHREVNLVASGSNGFSRAVNYGHGCDPDEPVLDALFMQYLTADRKDQVEIILIVQDDITHSIEEHRLADLKTVPVDQHPHMIAAAAKEIGDLIKIGTFGLDPEVPVNRKAVNSRIVFKVKHRADGSFDKFKARLVAKGFMQRLGFDFFSTFSPMATLTTVRTVFAIAVRLGLPIFHADIPQAFVNALLKEDVWLRLPPGVSINRDGKQHKIVKLLRALYGLRQSPQAFNKELVNFLVKSLPDLQFTQASADSCLFYYFNSETNTFILVASEVDDLIITGTDTKGIERLKRGLVERFKIDDTKWESLSSFLGININYDVRAGRMEMDIEQKVEKLLTDHPLLHNLRMHDVPSSDTAAEIPESAASKYGETDIYIKNNYASIIGACIYMSITVRNDITFAVGKCARGMHNPLPKHVAMLKQLVGYLKKTKAYKLVYCQFSNPSDTLFRDISKTDGALTFIATSDGKNTHHLVGLGDANFANITDEQRKSISGFAYFVFGCLVSWRSKLQTITAGSTHEAELIAIGLAANEGVWIRKLLIEIGFAVGLSPALSRPNVGPKPNAFLEDDNINELSDTGYCMKPFPLFNDNLGATQTVNNPVTSWRTRHLDVKYFKIRDYIKEQKLTVSHISTTLNVADFFTKALAYPMFSKFRNYLGIVPG